MRGESLVFVLMYVVDRQVLLVVIVFFQQLNADTLLIIFAYHTPSQQQPLRVSGQFGAWEWCFSETDITESLLTYRVLYLA
jgi:hypothetical protein